jgi:hypothetical protein
LIFSASARISKGQGYQGKGQGAVWPKKGNLRRTKKNLKNRQNFTPFRVNKMFSQTPVSFNTSKTLQVAP